MTAPLDVLAVMAHRDDAELLCGGSLIRSVDRGERVGVLDLTAGEMGSDGSADLRAQEAARAAEIMGLAERRCAGLPDAAIENSPDTRRVVVQALRALRPRVVVTHWRMGRHCDHRAASELVRDACFLSGLRRFEAEGAPFRPLQLVYATAFREDVSRPDFVIDVTDQIDRKLRAIEVYGSQFEGKSQGGEVLPGGSRPLMEQVRVQLAHYGSRIRVPYGEPFCVDEALRVDSLGALDVSSF